MVFVICEPVYARMPSHDEAGPRISRLPENAPPALSENTITIRDSRYNLFLFESQEYSYIQKLVSRIIRQLLNGCGDQACTNSACYTYQKRVAVKPPRKLSLVSARAKAIHLSSQKDFDRYICSTWPDGRHERRANVIKLLRKDGDVLYPERRSSLGPRVLSVRINGSANETPQPALEPMPPARKYEDREVEELGKTAPSKPTPDQRFNTSSKTLRDAKSFSQRVFETSFFKSLDLSSAQTSIQASFEPREMTLPHSLTHISWTIQDNLEYSFDISENFDPPTAEKPLAKSSLYKAPEVSPFLRQSCFYIFGRLDGIRVSFRPEGENKELMSKEPKNEPKNEPTKSLFNLSVPLLMVHAMEWWYARVGDLLLTSLLRALEDFDSLSNLSTIEEKLSDYSSPVHVLMVCILGLTSTAPGRIEIGDSARPSRQRLKGIDSFLHPASLHLATRLIGIIHSLHHLDVEPTENQKVLHGTLDSLWNQLQLSTPANYITLHRLRHWTRLVFQSEWDGQPFIARESYTGKALEVLDLLYFEEEKLLRSNERYYMPPIADYLDSIDLANERLDKGFRDTHWHILEFSWLFPQTSIFEYFRAECFVRMMDAVDKADLVLRILSNRSVNSPQGYENSVRLLRTASTRNLALFVRREALLADTFDQLWRREERELLRPLKVKIEHLGEQGIDEGGVAQEFFRLVFAEACGPNYGLFNVDPNTRMMWFNPACREQRWRFEALGLLVALAVYNGFTSPFTFPKILYSKLLMKPMSGLSAIRDGWPELTNGFEALLDWEDGDVEDTFMRTYEFSYDAYGKVVNVDMEKAKHTPRRALSHFWSDDYLTDKPDAALVTNANRSQYVSDYIFWLTQESIEDQYNAFDKGFRAVLHDDIIKHLTPEDLKILVEGHHEISMYRLREVTHYEGYSPNSPIITQFWSIVEDYSSQDKSRLLQFILATDRIPVLGYQSIEFVIQKNGPDSEQLPSSHTCFGRLLLPEYSSELKLREKLQIALDHSIGFGLR